MLSRLQSESWVVTGSGDGILAEPASHDGKAAKWRPMAGMVDTRRACAMMLAALRLASDDKGRPSWRSKAGRQQQGGSCGQCRQESARHGVARRCGRVVIDHEQAGESGRARCESRRIGVWWWAAARMASMGGRFEGLGCQRASKAVVIQAHKNRRASGRVSWELAKGVKERWRCEWWVVCGRGGGNGW